MISYIKINNCTPNVLYNNSIAMKLLVGKVGEFWWETRLWLKLIVGHCSSNDGFRGEEPQDDGYYNSDADDDD